MRTRTGGVAMAGRGQAAARAARQGLVALALGVASVAGGGGTAVAAECTSDADCEVGEACAMVPCAVPACAPGEPCPEVSCPEAGECVDKA